MICQYCNKEARWVQNKEIYGKNYGLSHMIWLCECGAYVGCHNNTKKPLGTLANKELRLWRREAHHHIDSLWDKKFDRGHIYLEMKNHFCKEVHIGESDIEMCKKIIEWAKSQRVS